jgi:hypothetical protein
MFLPVSVAFFKYLKERKNYLHKYLHSLLNLSDNKYFSNGGLMEILLLFISIHVYDCKNLQSYYILGIVHL